MNPNIAAAIDELDLLQAELESLKSFLNDDFLDLPEHEVKRALLRAWLTERSIKTLTNSIADEIAGLPLSNFDYDKNTAADEVE